MGCRSLLAITGVVLLCANVSRAALTFACDEKNDLYQSVVKGGARPARFDDAAKAIAHAEAGGGVLVLADGYPKARVRIAAKDVEVARAKRLRLYVELPETFPGIEFGAPRGAVWERGVVASDGLEAPLGKLRILSAHGCTFLPITNREKATPPPPSPGTPGEGRGEGLQSEIPNLKSKAEKPLTLTLSRSTGRGDQIPLLVLARVAGYDTAVYGLPAESFPLLFATADGHLVATTKLSGFVTGRYAPAAEWAALWRQILSKLDPAAEAPRLVIEPAVQASFGKDDPLPPGAEAHALARYAAWLRRPGLLVAPARQKPLHDLLRRGVETTDPPPADEPAGDGSLGILEGYASHVRPDGGQPRRLPLRADCHGEAAMVLALHALLANDENSRAVATNLLDFVYFNSGMHRGAFGDPSHPAFGHIAWGDIAPAWTVATYGDDNARALIGTVVAAACLGSDRWDEAALKGLLANLRTTGRLGFRGDRIDVPDLARNGWKHYHDRDVVNPAANFEAYPWAAFLWAYRHTGEPEFLEKARAGIGRMMKVYPRGWRWADNTERARMLLPLAWLVRVDDTPQHRRWLKTVATDLLRNQHACGAIREHLGGEGRGSGHYVVPASNEAYGTTETPLIQQNGDPVSDQLYNTGFALIGLHEAAAATGDAELKAAGDRLAAYLTRIQARSEAVPYLDGAWFRAFDYEKWECWASSADMGWGAWSVEAGWAPAWAATALGLRAKGTSQWELTAGSRMGERLPAVRRAMAANDGRPHAVD